MAVYRLREESFRPPTLVPPEDEIPWILIENQAYVADRRNRTTACSDCRCVGQVQVTLVAATPPRVSHICVFYRRPRTAAAAGGGADRHTDEEEGGQIIPVEPYGGGGGADRHTDEEDWGQMIPVEPYILATDEDLVLLRIIVSDGKDLPRTAAFEYFIYQPAGPKLTRLGRPNHYHGFNGYQVGLVSCTASRCDGGLSLLPPGGYVVAALSQDIDDTFAIQRGRFILHLYNSKLQTWTAIDVSLSEEHYQKYKDEEGYFIHHNTKVIAIGGEDATIAFVDLYRGILLCDLARVQDQPWLRYVPLPHRQSDTMIMGDARLSRDIAVVEGHFKFVLHCRLYDGGWVGWSSSMFTRPVSACSLSDDSWGNVRQVQSTKMDTENCLNFHLLPKVDLDGRPFSPFRDLHILQPTISLDTDHTVCFMAKFDYGDDEAWVLSVDMKNNRLREVAEFDATRYSHLGFAYLHSRISKYLKMAQGTKENLKRQGILLQGSPDKKLAWQAEMVGMAEGKGDGGAMLVG